MRRELRKADDYITELELSRDLSQTLVHVDCDAFYAAVEQLDRPELSEVPFAVGGGVLTTCNYHARKFGCRSGMAGFVAKKLCPQLIMIPLNFDKYTKKAQEVREVFAEYDPRFESASMDEAYLNITQYCIDHHIDPEDAVKQLRKEVHEKAKITVSAGIAANAKLAKICSNINKPNGQFFLPSDRGAIMKFMRELPCRKINGIGRVFERELDAIGIKTCGDIYQYRQFLSPLFGEKSFWFLMQCYLGLGRTEVHPAEEYERKSVGTERTFRDLKGHEAICERLRRTAEDLEKDMLKAQVKGRTLVLKVKLHTYEVFTRQTTPPRAVYQADDLYKYALPMLSKLEKEFPSFTLRLLGLRCTHLVSIKKPDTNAFFGIKTRRGSEAGASGHTTPEGSSPSSVQLKRKASSMNDADEWEQWPDAEFEDVEREEYQEQIKELEALSQEAGNKQEGGTKENASRSFKHYAKPAEPEEDEWWDCPICSRSQAANEKEFNVHIDLCLSRQAIKEAVHDEKRVSSLDREREKESHTPIRPEAKRVKTGSKEQAKGKNAKTQSKLSFD